MMKNVQQRINGYEIRTGNAVWLFDVRWVLITQRCWVSGGLVWRQWGSCGSRIPLMGWWWTQRPNELCFRNLQLICEVWYDVAFDTFLEHKLQILSSWVMTQRQPEVRFYHFLFCFCRLKSHLARFGSRCLQLSWEPLIQQCHTKQCVSLRPEQHTCHEIHPKDHGISLVEGKKTPNSSTGC